MDDYGVGRQAMVCQAIDECAASRRTATETRLQRFVYFSQVAYGVPFGYRFKMRYEGPYSDRLWGDLTCLRDAGFLVSGHDPETYELVFATTPGAARLLEMVPSFVAEHTPKLKRVSDVLGRGWDVEELATGLFLWNGGRLFDHDAHVAADQALQTLVALGCCADAERAEAVLQELGRLGLIGIDGWRRPADRVAQATDLVTSASA
jgi:hypothetical protein